MSMKSVFAFYIHTPCVGHRYSVYAIESLFFLFIMVFHACTTVYVTKGFL